MILLPINSNSTKEMKNTLLLFSIKCNTKRQPSIAEVHLMNGHNLDIRIRARALARLPHLKYVLAWFLK